jgi:hypothetical protein
LALGLFRAAWAAGAVDGDSRSPLSPWRNTVKAFNRHVVVVVAAIVSTQVYQLAFADEPSGNQQAARDITQLVGAATAPTGALAQPSVVGMLKGDDLKMRIALSERMLVLLGGDGEVKWIKGGGHDKELTSAEFNFEDQMLDLKSGEGSKMMKLLDMKAYTLMIMEVTDDQGEKKIKKFLWESSRHWW